MTPTAYAVLDRVSVVIVTWNGDDLLKDCLDSLVRTYGFLPETIVADNANLSSTAALVGSYANAKYVPLPENRGFAGGNNAALPFCTKDYILLLNNDTRFTADSISPLITFMDEHSNCAAAQGKIVIESTGKLDGCGGFLCPLGILAFRGAFADDAPEFNIPAQVFTIGGAFFAFRKSVLDQCGGLFYDHFKSYYEEVNFSHRLAIAGFDCWYVPTPPIIHRHSATSSKFNQTELLCQYYRNIWFSILTCFNFRNRLRFGAILAALSLGHVLVGLLRGNFAPFRSHCKAARKILREFGSEGSIRATRAELKKLRKRTDRQILAYAIRPQPWSYYKAIFYR